MWRPFLSSLFTFSPASVFFLKVALSSTIENGLLGKVPLFSTEAWILRNIEAESESWGRRSRKRIMLLQISQVSQSGDQCSCECSGRCLSTVVKIKGNLIGTQAGTSRRVHLHWWLGTSRHRYSGGYLGGSPLTWPIGALPTLHTDLTQN